MHPVSSTCHSKFDSRRTPRTPPPTSQIPVALNWLPPFHAHHASQATWAGNRSGPDGVAPVAKPAAEYCRGRTEPKQTMTNASGDADMDERRCGFNLLVALVGRCRFNIQLHHSILHHPILYDTILYYTTLLPTGGMPTGAAAVTAPLASPFDTPKAQVAVPQPEQQEDWNMI